jgi:hypothetical protein
MGGRVICEAKRIRSHLFLLRIRERLPNLVTSIGPRAGTLQPIDATMQICRTDCPASLYHSPAEVPPLAGSSDFSTAC